MNEFDLKHLIGQKTGVSLVRVAMPLLSGQMNLANRGLIWHEYALQFGLPEHFPSMMKNELKSFVQRFYDAYKQHVPPEQQGDFDSMMFVWYAEDASLTDDDFKKLDESNLDPGAKQKMAEVGKFIQEKGVPLAKSKSEFEKTRRKWDKDGGYNGGQVHLNHFGWAWGAQPGGMQDDGSRRSDYLPPEKLDNDAYMSTILQKGSVVMECVTAQVEGGWGIFLFDGTENVPPIPQKTLDQMKSHKAKTDQPLNPDDPAVKQILAGAGGIEKFYWYSSDKMPDAETHKTRFMPCQRRFYLNSPEDPKPKGILWKTPGAQADAGKKSVENHPANDGRHRGMYVGGTRRKPYVDPHIYIAMLRVNGTMFWQSQANPKEQFPMTKEQVDYFNRFKGKKFEVSNPGYEKYVFQNEQDQKKYEQDCYWLNMLRDFMTSLGKTHVASQRYQVLLVGPRFTAGKQVGEKQAPGFLATPETASPEPAQMQHGGNFTGRRDDWVIEKHEYSISDFRAQKEKGSFNAPQNVTGMAGQADIAGKTAEGAVAKAIRNYGLPERVVPDPARIQLAQQVFDKAQGFYAQQKAENPNQQPEQPAPVVDQQSVQPPLTEAPAPVQPQQPVPAQPVTQPQNDIFDKSSKDILSNLKKLG